MSSPGSTPRSTRSRRGRDREPAATPSSPRSRASSSPTRLQDEGSGDELNDDALMREDYKAIPELDQYESRGLDQEGDYDAISPSARSVMLSVWEKV